MTSLLRTSFSFVPKNSTVLLFPNWEICTPEVLLAATLSYFLQRIGICYFASSWLIPGPLSPHDLMAGQLANFFLSRLPLYRSFTLSRLRHPHCQVLWLPTSDGRCADTILSLFHDLPLCTFATRDLNHCFLRLLSPDVMILRYTCELSLQLPTTSVGVSDLACSQIWTPISRCSSQRDHDNFCHL
jgi:hypothetical protein